MENKPTVTQPGKLPNLWLCIIMDALGCITYLVPLFAEVADVVWAPLSSFVLYRIFGGTVGKAGAVINFIEEAFPGLDFIPTFTLTWLYVKYMERN